MPHFKIIDPDYITAPHLFVSNMRHKPINPMPDAINVQSGGSAGELGSVVHLSMTHRQSRCQATMTTTTAVRLALALLRNAGVPDVAAALTVLAARVEQGALINHEQCSTEGREENAKAWDAADTAARALNAALAGAA